MSVEQYRAKCICLVSYHFHQRRTINSEISNRSIRKLLISHIRTISGSVFVDGKTNYGYSWLENMRVFQSPLRHWFFPCYVVYPSRHNNLYVSCVFYKNFLGESCTVCSSSSLLQYGTLNRWFRVIRTSCLIQELCILFFYLFYPSESIRGWLC